MLKRTIIDRALYGLPLDGRDVARVSRCRKYLTYRHTWADDTDGRVWDGVRFAARKLAQTVANQTGRSVAIYASGGWRLDEVWPEGDSAE